MKILSKLKSFTLCALCLTIFGTKSVIKTQTEKQTQQKEKKKQAKLDINIGNRRQHLGQQIKRNQDIAKKLKENPDKFMQDLAKILEKVNKELENKHRN